MLVKARNMEVWCLSKVRLLQPALVQDADNELGVYLRVYIVWADPANTRGQEASFQHAEIARRRGLLRTQGHAYDRSGCVRRTTTKSSEEARVQYCAARSS